MILKDTVYLFCPAGSDESGTVWKSYVLSNVELRLTENEDGLSGVMYVFTDKVRAYICGKSCKCPKIFDGCAVAQKTKNFRDVTELCEMPPENLMKVVKVEYFSSGSHDLHHIKLTLR